MILEYELRDKSREMKEIDLLHLTPEYVFLIIISRSNAATGTHYVLTDSSSSVVRDMSLSPFRFVTVLILTL